MVKVAWKVVNGYGPYGYLQKSIKYPDGKVVSKHLAYLGAIGTKGVYPGKFHTVPPSGEFDGGRFLLNPVPGSIKKLLKPNALALLNAIEQQVQSGVDSHDIVLAKKGMKKPSGTSAPPSKPPSQSEKAPTKPADATKPGPSKQPGKPPAKEELGATPKKPKPKAKQGSSQPALKPAGPKPDAAKKAGSPAAPKSGTKQSPPVAGKPTISTGSVENVGQPLIAASNVKKLQNAAATGNMNTLEKTAAQISSTKIGSAKKEAIAKFVEQMKEQLTGPQGKAVSTESSQSSPANAATKDWDSDLEQVGKQQGSNPGALFKDKESGSLHYVKWSGSDLRSRVEVLAGLLYAHADVPMPHLRAINFKDQTAVASDWLSDAKPMTVKEMQAHPDVRENFLVDAWLANWDVIGLEADNIVRGEGNKAYRIDVGGSLLFRAQGKPKHFNPWVEELKSLLDPNVNQQSAAVFKNLTEAELLAGAAKVGAITDQQIETSVGQMQLPKTSPDYPNSEDIPGWLRHALKKRRDYIVQEVAKKILHQQDTTNAPTGETTTVPTVNRIPSGFVSAANLKKLHQAALTGNVGLMEAAGEKLQGGLKSPAKKSGIAHVVADLKAQMSAQPGQEASSASGLAQTIEDVNDGDLELPEASVPPPAVAEKHADLVAQEKKDWDADLEQVAGQKGSNPGALFKDRHLNTFHYVKWSSGDARARIEALAGALYALADVPVPTLRTIEYNGQTAVMSDWLDGAEAMTADQMKKNADVRRNFVVDAWLANWDVIGSKSENIVKGPGGKAYRVDLGGSMIFRALGGDKGFPADVGELETMLGAGQNAIAAKVFDKLTEAELKAGAARVEAISDQQIDETVDQMGIPKSIPEYPASTYGDAAADLPTFLKTRLKQRRDFIATEVLKVIDLNKKKAAALKNQVTNLKKDSGLNPETLELLVDQAPKLTLSTSTSQRKKIQEQVLTSELGQDEGKQASESVASAFDHWKSSTNTPGGRLLRWASGEIDGYGDRELRRLQKFNEFLVSKKTMTPSESASQLKKVSSEAKSVKGTALVDGLKVTRKANRVASLLQNPSKKTVTIYRGWKQDQLEYLKLTDAKVGDTIELEDPPIYSWSFSQGTAKNFGHGSIVTKASVPVDKIILTDRVNNTGGLDGENEILFKGVPKQKLEVTHKY